MTVENQTIMFIHGAWMNSECWDKFTKFFTEKGYNCVAPPWPFKDGTVEELNHSPNPELGKLQVKDIADHYQEKLQQYDEQPILIGHSFGGLFVQQLLDRGYGSSGVAIHPAPPKSVLPYYWSVIKSNFHILRNPFKSRKIIRISQKNFNYAFLNGLDKAEQEEIYKSYVVPESGRIFFQTAFSDFNSQTKVNFKNNSRSPLLIISGTTDHIVPKKMVEKNYKKYKKSQAKTDYLEFEGRGHWTIGQKNWETVANQIYLWLNPNIDK